MLLPLLLNQLSVTDAKIHMPGKGTWIADLNVDLDISGAVPFGKAVLTVGTKLLLGTIDPRSSGKFGSSAKVQIVGGGGGWDKPILPLHIHNDVGVLSSAVFSVVASSVGEVVLDALPKRLGVDYVCTAGPASRVLSGVDWYVNEAGVTIVGPRVPVPFNPLSVEILEWDPTQRIATLASNEIVMPGTILLDVRFGKAVVRDVEQSFGADGARTIAWCDTSDLPAIPGAPASETAGNRLARALGAHAREASGVTLLRRYRYRTILQGADKRLTLQNVEPLPTDSPAPYILQQIDIWPGIAGATSTVAPGTEVHVVFENGDASKPRVVGFMPGGPMPLETKLEAVRIALGSIAVDPVAKAPGTQAQIAALTAAVAVIATYIATVTNAAITIPLFPAYAAALVGPGNVVAGALGGLSAAIAAQVPLAVSAKTFTD